MAIDIRATVLLWTVNPEDYNYIPPSQGGGLVYEVISGSVSDDYIQGNALITTKGSCVLKGAARLNQKQPVWITYTKVFRGSTTPVTRAIPRLLLVFSSFADPYRRTTAVELGCNLAYHKNAALAPKPVAASSLTEDTDGDPVEVETNIVTRQVRFKNIFLAAVSAAGYNEATVSGGPESGGLSVDEYTISGPYLSTANDLLLSYSLYAFSDILESNRLLPEREGLRVRMLSIGPHSPTRGLNLEAKNVPVLTDDQIIDIGPLNIGDIPAETVLVEFSYLKLKAPEDVELICDATFEEQVNNWYVDSTSSSSTSVIRIAYTDPATQQLATRDYVSLESSYEEVITRRMAVRDASDLAQFVEEGDTLEDEVTYKEVVIQRKMYESTSTAAVVGGFISAALSAGFNPGNSTLNTDTIEVFSYDGAGNEIQRVLTRTSSSAELVGSVGLQMVYPSTENPGQQELVPLPDVTMTREKIFTYTSRFGNVVKTLVRRYGAWLRSIPGQQSIAEARDAFTDAQQVTTYLSSIAGSNETIQLDTTVTVARQGDRTDNTVSTRDLANANLAADSGDPDSGFRTENSSETSFVLGSPGAVSLTASYSVPFSPDDSFRAIRVPFSDPPRYCYTSQPGNAEGLAETFGKVQNRLANGVRNGLNVQVAPEDAPQYPFDGVIIKVGNAYGLYGATGTTWTFDNQGMVVSFDAIYWGAAGR
jgi:hypothetical protein